MRAVTITTTITRGARTSRTLFQLKHTARVWDCAVQGCPAIFVLRDGPDMFFDKHWQFHLVASNWGMDLRAIMALIGNSKAFANNTGIGADPPRANWISGSNLTAQNPRYDKFRTCALNTHAGEKTYSLLFALQNILAAAREVMAGRNTLMGVNRAMQDIAATNAVRLETMDGRLPPPMKPGKNLPDSLQDINPDDYLLLPGPETRHLFIDASNIKNQPGGGYRIGPFAHGLVRDWIGDGMMHSFLPFASWYTILSPLQYWTEIPSGSPFPSPFKRS